MERVVNANSQRRKRADEEFRSAREGMRSFLVNFQRILFPFVCVKAWRGRKLGGFKVLRGWMIRYDSRSRTLICALDFKILGGRLVVSMIWWYLIFVLIDIFLLLEDMNLIG